MERARSAPKGRAYLETIVTFVDKQARDDVFSRGPMLAGFRDEDGRPTCGLRLHIPGFLMSSFKVLESFSFYLRNKHRGEITKYIKFDEHEQTLFLQVRHKSENDWIFFSVDQAREEMAKNNSVKAQKSRLLSESVEPSRGNEKRVEQQAAGGNGPTTPGLKRTKRMDPSSSNRAPRTPLWKPPARQPAAAATSAFFPEKPAKRGRDERETEKDTET